MPESWMPIFRRRTDGLVSILVDLDYRERCPDPSRSSAAMIAVAFEQPGEHGLGEAADSESIDAVMDTLGPRLASEAGAAYVGRVRGGGEARVWLYSAAEHRDRIERLARQAFAGRQIEVQHRDDPQWDMYIAMTPSPREERVFLDAQVVQQLEEHGDPLTPKRDVRHFAYFADPTAAKKFASRVSGLGFKTGVEKSERQDETRPWCVSASRDDSVEHPQISEITGDLAELADELGGEYDGWEAMLVKPKQGLFGRLFKK